MNAALVSLGAKRAQGQSSCDCRQLQELAADGTGGKQRCMGIHGVNREEALQGVPKMHVPMLY